MPHTLTWQEQGQVRQAQWRNTATQKPPAALAVAEAGLSAKAVLKIFRQGQALLWRGDYHQAVQLLSAVKRQLPAAASPDFHTHRMQQAQRSRLANMLLVEIDVGYRLNLRRAPDISAALADVFGEPNSEPFLLPLNLLLGFIGAHQWHKKGVAIPALGARIHVPFGVFSPLRGEYLGLIAAAPLPPHARSAFDIGTGSGVIAALLAQRGLCPRQFPTPRPASNQAAANRSFPRRLRRPYYLQPPLVASQTRRRYRNRPLRPRQRHAASLFATSPRPPPSRRANLARHVRPCRTPRPAPTE